MQDIRDLAIDLKIPEILQEQQFEKIFIVYAHINKINNKIYIGQTCQNPLERWRSGNGYLGKNKKGEYRQPKIAIAIEKYGWDNFDHIFLYKTNDPIAADNFERKMILEFNTVNDGYNLSGGGVLEHEHSDETKQKISKSNMGKVISEEQRKHHSEVMKRTYSN